jgi:hypothetical protein
MPTLTGSTTLNVANVPRPKTKEKKMSLKDPEFVVKTYRISSTAVNTLENITKRLCKETKIKLSMGKILELAIFHIDKMPFEELIK